MRGGHRFRCPPLFRSSACAPPLAGQPGGVPSQVTVSRGVSSRLRRTRGAPSPPRRVRTPDRHAPLRRPRRSPGAEGPLPVGDRALSGEPRDDDEHARAHPEVGAARLLGGDVPGREDEAGLPGRRPRRLGLALVPALHAQGDAEPPVPAQPLDPGHRPLGDVRGARDQALGGELRALQRPVGLPLVSHEVGTPGPQDGQDGHRRDHGERPPKSASPTGARHLGRRPLGGGRRSCHRRGDEGQLLPQDLHVGQRRPHVGVPVGPLGQPLAGQRQPYRVPLVLLHPHTTSSVCSRARSARTAACSRLLTVPSGMSSASAISATARSA